MLRGREASGKGFPLGIEITWLGGSIQKPSLFLSKDALQMNVSFQPNGKWFVFDEASGATLQKDLPTKNAALIWLHTERVKAGQ